MILLLSLSHHGTRLETRRVETARFTIGRAECDWQLPPDWETSRVHCIIERVDDGFLITDVSTNGTYLNGHREPLGRGNSSLLADGDRIAISGYVIAVTLIASTSASEEPLMASASLEIGSPPMLAPLSDAALLELRRASRPRVALPRGEQVPRDRPRLRSNLPLRWIEEAEAKQIFTTAAPSPPIPRSAHPAAAPPMKRHYAAWAAIALAAGGGLAWTFRSEIVAAISALGSFFHLVNMLPRRGWGEVETAMALTAASPPPPARARRPQRDLVDVSAFAPETVPSAGLVLIQVFLHRLSEAEVVAAQAREPDREAVRRSHETLAAEIERGKRVDILLDAKNLTVEDTFQSVTWRGEPCSCQFIVGVPPFRETVDGFVRIRVMLDSVPIGSLRFALRVRPAPVTPGTRPALRGDSARRYQWAFLSYTTADRPEVVKRAQALRAAGIGFFQDILSLEPGERWERRLYAEIDRCDLFLLFWSKNAAASEWVLREARHAVDRQHSSPDEEPDITPIILEGPPVPEPIPAWLSHLHFNDHLLYLIAPGRG